MYIKLLCPKCGGFLSDVYSAKTCSIPLGIINRLQMECVKCEEAFEITVIASQPVNAADGLRPEDVKHAAVIRCAECGINLPLISALAIRRES